MEVLTDKLLMEIKKLFDEQEVYILARSPIKLGNYRVPRDERINNYLLNDIIYAINDGFYSDKACLEYIRDIVREAMKEDIKINGNY